MTQIIPHGRWRDARAKILDLHKAGPSVVAVFGAPGTGKTLLLRDLALTFAESGHDVRMFDRGDILLDLVATRVVLIDEADRISDEALKDVGRKRDGFFVLAAIPAAAERLQAAFAKMTVVELMPLTMDEAGAFIAARLAQGGQPADLLTDDAVTKLAVCSAGVPRVLETLIKLASFSASLEGNLPVTGAHVEQAAALLAGGEEEQHQAEAPTPILSSHPSETIREMRAAPREDALDPPPLPPADTALPRPVAGGSALFELGGSHASHRSLSQGGRRAMLAGGVFAFVSLVVLAFLLAWAETRRPNPPPALLVAENPASFLPATGADPTREDKSSEGAIEIPILHAEPAAEGHTDIAAPVPPPGASDEPPPGASAEIVSPGTAPVPQADAPPATFPADGPIVAMPPGPRPLPNEETTSAAPPAPLPAVGPTPAFQATASAADVPVSLPASTPLRVVLSYPRGDARAAAHGAELARTLRSSGFMVGDPIPVPEKVTEPQINFFFLQDRPGAEDIGRRLDGRWGQADLVLLPQRNVLPRPGTIEIMVPAK